MHDLKELQQMIPRSLPSWPLWLTVVVCGILTTGAFYLDVIQPLGVAGGIPYVAVVLISSFASNRLLTAVLTLLSVLLIVLGFHLSPPGAAEWIDSLNRTQAIAVVVLIAAVLIHRISVLNQRELMMQELGEAVDRIKLLHGLLPICSACKKIKTEAGLWRQLESYIQEHSQAEFTHGICNECAETLYKDFVEKRAQEIEPDEAALAAREARRRRDGGD